MSFKYVEDPILGKGRAEFENGGGGGETDTLEKNFFISGNRAYFRIGYLPNGGKLVVSEKPSGMTFGIQAFFDDRITMNQKYNSGWQTSAPFDVEINPNWYYLFVAVKNDFSAITDADIAMLDDFVIQENYDIIDIIERDERAMEKREFYQSLTCPSVAHRGARWGAPQNTARAYILAQKLGFKKAENDLARSQDGQYVMWHDTDLARLGTNLVDLSGYEIYTNGAYLYYYHDAANDKLYTYGTSYVETDIPLSTLTQLKGANCSVQSLPLPVLKRIDFGAYLGEEWKGTQILTFEEWLILCKKLGLDAYIDTKYTYTAQTFPDIFAIVQKTGMVNNVVWENIGTTALADIVRTSDPTARMCIFAVPTAELVSTWSSYNTGRGFFFNPSLREATQADVKIALDAGFDVEGWYVAYDNGYQETSDATLRKIQDYVSWGLTGITLDEVRSEDIIPKIEIPYSNGTYVVTSNGSSGVGTLNYALTSTASNGIGGITFASNTNSQTLNMNNATLDKLKNIVGNGKGVTELTGAFSYSSGVQTQFANLTLDNVTCSGGIMVLCDCEISSGSTVSPAGSGDIMPKLVSGGGTLNMNSKYFPTLNSANALYIMSGINITSGDGANGVCMISGGGLLSATSCTFESNGHSGVYGAALAIQGGSAYLNGCTFRNNVDNNDIFLNNGGRATFVDCTFVGDRITPFGATTYVEFIGSNTVYRCDGGQGHIVISSGGTLNFSGNAMANPLNTTGSGYIEVMDGGVQVITSAGSAVFISGGTYAKITNQGTTA